MPEGGLLGRVILTCPKKEEVLDLPAGTPVMELLSKAEAVFGRGRVTDRSGRVVTPRHPKLDGGFYTWSPKGADAPGVLYVCQKGARRWPDVHGYAFPVEPGRDGIYSYGEFAQILGCNGWTLPKCIILGDPEIMWIYPTELGAVYIDRSDLGDWGTKEKPIPLEGLGWWGMIKEFVAPPAMSLQPHDLKAGPERCTAVETH